MKTLAIINCAPIFSIGLEYFFSNSTHFRIVFVCFEESLLWQKLQNTQPDFILLDSRFAPLCLKIKEETGTASKILILGTSADAQHLKGYFDAGAVGFTLQTIDTNALVEALNRIEKGERYIHQDLFMAYLELQPSLKININTITKREQEVLNLIIDEKTTQEIASQLYISLATVETHRQHLIRKFGVKNTAGLVREAMKIGLQANYPHRP